MAQEDEQSCRSRDGEREGGRLFAGQHGVDEAQRAQGAANTAATTLAAGVYNTGRSEGLVKKTR